MAGVASKAKKGAGTLLKIGDGAEPEVFTAIGDIVSVKNSGSKFDEIDVTHLNSPVDANGNMVKEWQLGQKDYGTVDLEMNVTLDDEQDTLQAAEGTKVNFEWHFPQLITASYAKGVKFTFAALVNSVTMSPDPKGTIKGTCSLRVTGPMTAVALT